MQQILINAFNHLRKGGKLVLVIGNSAYMNVLVPTDLLIAEMAKNIGFAYIKINIARSLTTSSQQRLALNKHVNFLRESVIEVYK